MIFLRDLYGELKSNAYLCERNSSVGLAGMSGFNGIVMTIRQFYFFQSIDIWFAFGASPCLGIGPLQRLHPKVVILVHRSLARSYPRVDVYLPVLHEAISLTGRGAEKLRLEIFA